MGALLLFAPTTLDPLDGAFNLGDLLFIWVTSSWRVTPGGGLPCVCVLTPTMWPIY